MLLQLLHPRNYPRTHPCNAASGLGDAVPSDAGASLDPDIAGPPVTCTAEDALAGVLRPKEVDSAHIAVDPAIFDRTKRLRECLEIAVSSGPDNLHRALGWMVRYLAHWGRWARGEAVT